MYTWKTLLRLSMLCFGFDPSLGFHYLFLHTLMAKHVQNKRYMNLENQANTLSDIPSRPLLTPVHHQKASCLTKYVKRHKLVAHGFHLSLFLSHKFLILYFVKSYLDIFIKLHIALFSKKLSFPMIFILYVIIYF